jgi:two-component system nitrogen regulation response regulator GlnG
VNTIDIPPEADPRTLTSPLEAHEQEGLHALALTVLWHPAWRLAGAQALHARPGEPWSLSRTAPGFRVPDRVELMPLASPALSRSPATFFEAPDGGVELALPERTLHCEVDGRRVEGRLRLDAAAVERGVVMVFGGQVALCLHRVRTLPDGGAAGDLAGVSDAMVRVRRRVAQVAATSMPVLVLGESGTGKERVAQEIHARSARREGALVAVNMGALTDSLAAGDLFGTQRGAYTGAQQARPGYWREAEGGTLFLDEVGDTPALVQPMLLRAIETGHIRPLGATRDVPCDVRLLAATDRDLAVQGFNQPLLRRLEAFVIRIPPLRERREDVGMLAARLLAQAAPGLPDTLMLPPALVRALCLFDWPGNVRQLLHAMRRLALAQAVGEWPGVHDFLGVPASEAVLPTSATAFPATAADHSPARGPGAAPPAVGGEPPAASDTADTADGASSAGEPAVAATDDGTARTPPRRYRLPSTVSGEELTAALDASGWCLRDAAERLGVSRPSLYNLMHRHPELRRVERLQPEDVAAARRAGALDLPALATALRVPREALRRRLQAWEADAGRSPGPPEGA